MGKSKDCLNAVLFVNLLKKNTSVLSDTIKTELEKRGVKVTVFSFEETPKEAPEGRWDVAFSLGGDGTVLFTARCLARLGVPIIPVNFGTLGFLAGVKIDDWLSVFESWERGEITPSNRYMLNIFVERDSKIILENFCLNDAVISCTGIAKLIKLNVHLADNKEQRTKNKEQLTGGKISMGSYRCDGLIISTPTGSTAYSMAAGGPILDPDIEAAIINPICPFALSNRPYVLTSKQTIIVTVAENQRSGVLLTIDGQNIFSLECDDKIIIKQSPHYAQLIYPGKYAYYSALRNKLYWLGEAHDASLPRGGNNA